MHVIQYVWRIYIYSYQGLPIGERDQRSDCLGCDIHQYQTQSWHSLPMHSDIGQTTSYQKIYKEQTALHFLSHNTIRKNKEACDTLNIIYIYISDLEVALKSLLHALICIVLVAHPPWYHHTSWAIDIVQYAHVWSKIECEITVSTIVCNRKGRYMTWIYTDLKAWYIGP